MQEIKKVTSSYSLFIVAKVHEEKLQEDHPIENPVPIRQFIIITGLMHVVEAVRSSNNVLPSWF